MNSFDQTTETLAEKHAEEIYKNGDDIGAPGVYNLDASFKAGRLSARDSLIIMAKALDLLSMIQYRPTFSDDPGHAINPAKRAIEAVKANKDWPL